MRTSIAAFESRPYNDFVQSVEDLTGGLRAPSISVAVTTADKLQYADAFGWADVAGRRRATTTTSYLWFSMSKIATATAALRLADEGRLDLDAPISTYVPEYPRPRGTTPEPCVGQLLNHTAGLANPVPLRWVRPVGAPAPDPDTFLRSHLSRRAAYRHPVGGTAHYSNLGYLVLAKIIAVAAGEPFESYMRRSVLEPAGMQGTGCELPADPDQAVGYITTPAVARPALRLMLPRGVVGRSHGRGLTAFQPFVVNGPGYGGLIGNVTDAARLAALHLGDGQLDGHRVLAIETARQMRRITTPGRPFDFGQAWFRSPTADSTNPPHVEHLGAGGGFYNVIRLYPELGIGIVVMANTTKRYDVDHLCDLLRLVPWRD